jgi:hypothetical protein
MSINVAAELYKPASRLPETLWAVDSPANVRSCELERGRDPIKTPLSAEVCSYRLRAMKLTTPFPLTFLPVAFLAPSSPLNSPARPPLGRFATGGLPIPGSYDEDDVMPTLFAGVSPNPNVLEPSLLA